MITDFSGDFLNFESTQDGDIFEIIDEGKVEFNEILKKDMFNLKVKRGEKVMIYSPSNTAGRELQKAFGIDSKTWLGKKFEVLHVQGRIIIRPIRVERVQ